ncbi:MAG: rhomboid family intramembrane serine protease [Candidatus Acidiferrales bacterium]
MIPLKNLNHRSSFPGITLLLIIVNFIVFFHQLQLDPHAMNQFILTFGLVPSRISLALTTSKVHLSNALPTLLSSMFLHGGWLHIIGNMWFLWIFGEMVEDRLGHAPYLLFYLACGVGAGVSQLLFDWGSNIPSIGASGAISGVMGAYLILFPGARILTLIPLFIIWFTARIPAVLFIGLWFIVQFLSGIGSLSMAPGTGGIAWWAHVGGFLLGVLLVLPFRRKATPTYI